MANRNKAHNPGCIMFPLFVLYFLFVEAAFIASRWGLSGMQVSQKVVSDKHCKSSDVLTCMQSDANFHFVVWPVSDTEVLDCLEK